MKTFVITLSNNISSVKSTKQTIQSAKDVGYTEPIERFEGILPNDWHNHIHHGGNDIFHIYRKPDNVAACFASHYLLWKKCIELNEPILILEHDAIFKQNIPDIDFDMCVTFGRPSYMRPFQMVYKELIDGLQPLVQENFLGHHAYAIKPEAAKIFCEDVESRKLSANDIWINTHVYPWLQEYNPYPIWADTKFSTIQEDWRQAQALENGEELVELSVLDNYKLTYPNLLMWEEGTYENKYVTKHFLHCLTAPQSKSYIDV